MKRLHLGIQVENHTELAEVYSRLQETFLTAGESTTYGTEEPAMAGI